MGVPNAMVSEDDHHPMIQLSDDGSKDPIPLPLDFDEFTTPYTDRSPKKPVLAPQHVQSSVTTTPNIQHQASGRSSTVPWATPPGTPNRFLQPMNTGSPTSLDTDQEPLHLYLLQPDNKIMERLKYVNQLVVKFRVVLNIILLSNFRNIVNINYIVYLKGANVVYQPLTFTYSDT